MASLFSQPQQIKGAFRADQVSISISGIVTGMLITRAAISFEQPISMVYALENLGASNGVAAGANNTGGSNVYMVAGRPAGSSQIERIVGPVPINAPWLTQFGNACNVVNNDMTFAAAAGNCLVGGTGTSQTGQYKMKGCVITRFGLNVQSEQAMISNAIDLRFSDLIIPD